MCALPAPAPDSGVSLGKTLETWQRALWVKDRGQWKPNGTESASEHSGSRILHMPLNLVTCHAPLSLLFSVCVFTLNLFSEAENAPPKKKKEKKKQLLQGQKKLLWLVSRQASISLFGPGITPQHNLQVQSNKRISREMEIETGIVSLLKLQGGFWVWLSYELKKA